MHEWQRHKLWRLLLLCWWRWSCLLLLLPITITTEKFARSRLEEEHAAYSRNIAMDSDPGARCELLRRQLADRPVLERVVHCAVLGKELEPQQPTL